jgi:hypothetical protein
MNDLTPARPETALAGSGDAASARYAQIQAVLSTEDIGRLHRLVSRLGAETESQEADPDQAGAQLAATALVDLARSLATADQTTADVRGEFLAAAAGRPGLSDLHQWTEQQERRYRLWAAALFDRYAAEYLDLAEGPGPDRAAQVLAATAQWTAGHLRSFDLFHNTHEGLVPPTAPQWNDDQAGYARQELAAIQRP